MNDTNDTCTGVLAYNIEDGSAHSHQDYPERDDEKWLVHTIASLENNNVKLSTREVIREVLDDDIEAVPLSKRVY